MIKRRFIVDIWDEHGVIFDRYSATKIYPSILQVDEKHLFWNYPDLSIYLEEFQSPLQMEILT